MRAERSCTFRGIAPRLIRTYLLELGAVEREGRLVAQGWEAIVSSLAPERVGSLELQVVRVELCGDVGVIEALLPRLRQKTFRAGG